jgi:hypothetical protein
MITTSNNNNYYHWNQDRLLIDSTIVDRRQLFIVVITRFFLRHFSISATQHAARIRMVSPMTLLLVMTSPKTLYGTAFPLIRLHRYAQAIGTGPVTNRAFLTKWKKASKITQWFQNCSKVGEREMCCV